MKNSMGFGQQVCLVMATRGRVLAEQGILAAIEERIVEVCGADRRERE